MILSSLDEIINSLGLASVAIGHIFKDWPVISENVSKFPPMLIKLNSTKLLLVYVAFADYNGFNSNLWHASAKHRRQG